MSESLGKTLRKIREAKKLSIQEVSERTRIPKKNIFSIEEDRLSEFSSAFYAKSFVKSYSEFLGAAEDKVVKGFLEESPGKDKPKLVLKGEEAPDRWFIKYKRLIGLGLISIFALWILFTGFVKIGRFLKDLSQRHKARVALKKEEDSRVKAQRPLPQDAVKTQEDNAASPVDLPKKISDIELEITARYNTWIQIKSGEELLFRGILKKNSSDVWRSDKDISLELGNAGGVNLKLNGKKLGYPGKRGEKKEIIVTKDGIK